MGPLLRMRSGSLTGEAAKQRIDRGLAPARAAVTGEPVREDGAEQHLRGRVEVRVGADLAALLPAPEHRTAAREAAPHGALAVELELLGVALLQERREHAQADSRHAALEPAQQLDERLA